ncbi:hypothetical protein [Burkholderia cepacia]|uniref:hypothetical protein n=1 Tax=Burkholderia cepacia TaxID=292 RepID=UPI0009C1A233|nr:hypothetical protein [Burkholderia cepacia]
MHAPFEMTEGQKRLAAIIESLPPDSPYWNEAQNRYQFVDRLLEECLGWQKPDIEVERSDELGGRSDYILGKPPKAVLEAKREAILFDIPPAPAGTTLRKLQPLLQASKPLMSAVQQVIPYCAIHGAQIAIVCNGPQLVIFQALTPGQSPLEGECYFFNGLSSLLSDFTLLWKILSPEGVSENRAYRDLALHRHPRLPPKASTAIAEPTKYRYRNDFQENLRSLSFLLLEQIEENQEIRSDFYRECYVPIEANNRHLLLSKNIIEARYRRSGVEGIAPSAFESVAVVNGDKDLQFTDPSVSNGLGSRPIVVIGDVGVGKTSFFENLFENLDSNDKANTYFLHLNLGIKANLTDDLKGFVLTEIPAILKTKYGVDIFSADFAKAIYHQDLVDFDSSVEGQLKEIDPTEYAKAKIAYLSNKISIKDAHLQAALGHIARGRRKQIVLVLDNADQRNFAIQQEAFLIAQELAATRNLTVFVALRPSTFYLSKTTGALSAYQNKILTISPPPADEVIQRRLIFAARVAEGKVAPAALSGIRLNLGNIALFLKTTLLSIRTNDAIKQFISNITGGNTRSVIELITGFFGSPNVDSRKIVEIENTTGDYKIPLHEFTKHALLGEYAYFNSQSSTVAYNIFDISSADTREHFLGSLIVAFLSSNMGTVDNDGFVHGASIISEMSRLGFIVDQIRFALRRLATKRLIETPHAHYREIPVDDHEHPEQFHYRATSVGIYHLRFWTGSFAFLDAVSTDTPILDENARTTVCKFASSFNIQDRLKKCECFLDYLESQWHLANIVVNYYDFVSLVQAQSDSFASVRVAVERAALRRGSGR